MTNFDTKGNKIKGFLILKDLFVVEISKNDAILPSSL